LWEHHDSKLNKTINHSPLGLILPSKDMDFLMDRLHILRAYFFIQHARRSMFQRVDIGNILHLLICNNLFTLEFNAKYGNEFSSILIKISWLNNYNLIRPKTFLNSTRIEHYECSCKKFSVNPLHSIAPSCHSKSMHWRNPERYIYWWIQNTTNKFWTTYYKH